MINQTSSPSLTPQEYYTLKNRYYDWQKFRYQIPKHYHHTQSNSKIPIKFADRTNYLDDVIRDKKKIPGPNKYQIQENIRPISGKMNKAQRKTVVDSVIDSCKKQKIPGPGYYQQNRPQTAGNVITNKSNVKEHYLNQVQYLSVSSPGVGHYNLTKAPHHITGPKLTRPQSQKGLNNMSKSKKKYKKLQTDASKTIIPGTFDRMALQSKSKKSKLFGTSKRFITDKKAKQPAPNSYKLNNKWTAEDFLMNKTASTTNCFRNVYYG